MKALVWHGGHSLRVEDMPRPEPGPSQILVKVEAAAICTSDLHMDAFGQKPPLILGHEVAGTVAGVAKDASGWSVGERVALDPVQWCGECWFCTRGFWHLCENFRHLGWEDTQGGWAEYVVIDAANAHAVPEGVDMVSASLVEPLAVCYESFQRAALMEGDQVLVTGDGPFGFLHAQLARAMGATKIIVAGHYDERLARIAARTGAVTSNTNHQALQAVLDAEVARPGLDVVVEASGAAEMPHIAIRNLRPRGTLVLFSPIWKPEPLDMNRVQHRELNLLGSARSLNAYGPCLGLLSRGQVDTRALVDMEVPFEDHETAIEALNQRKANVFKVVFLPQA